MKLMMYLFPVMMLFFMNSLPAGLSYYYLLANVISILQMTLFKQVFVNEDKIRAQLLLEHEASPRRRASGSSAWRTCRSSSRPPRKR